jgi:multisubunit Na+/H+ antiporter MnhB subunit
MVEVSIFILLVFMIVGMLFVLDMKNLLSAVVMMGAIGFGLSVIFLLLSAPDLAIVQIAVEVISLVILIRATIHREIDERAEETASVASRIVMLAGLILLFLVLYPAISLLPIFGDPVFIQYASSSSMRYIAEGFTLTGSPNIVSAIILDFRAYDTLGEAIVLFTSVMGAVSILRYRNRKKLEHSS